VNDKNQETYERVISILAIALFRQRLICDKFVTFGFGTLRILPLPKANIFQHALRERKSNDEFHDLLFSNQRAGRGWRRANHGFLRWARMIPSSWDWQKKAKILQACLQSFCFTLPHSRSECTRAHFFISVFIRVIGGFILFFPVV
jgi:hypothetical protein